MIVTVGMNTITAIVEVEKGMASETAVTGTTAGATKDPPKNQMVITTLFADGDDLRTNLTRTNLTNCHLQTNAKPTATTSFKTNYFFFVVFAPRPEYLNAVTGIARFIP